MIVDCISDLHGFYPKLEGGDILIVSGDLTARDEPNEVVNFGLWVNEQKYRRKIIIAGNHDNMIQITPSILQGLPDFVLTYLCDSGTEFEGLKIWGSPWTLKFPGMNPHCMAFTVDTEEELAEKWKLIPEDTDILVTHMPPYGMLDGIQNYETGNIDHVGSHSLLNKIQSLSRVKLHVFGHIHEGYELYDWRDAQRGHWEKSPTVFINASHVNERYEPVNKPIRIEL